jgi:hypothetical protein
VPCTSLSHLLALDTSVGRLVGRSVGWLACWHVTAIFGLPDSDDIGTAVL